ncbi:hypothetical protein ACLI4U_15460 [Natrialbaceae archaeon A-CW2]|uniref:hypothetical protein n=1 Tax=Natronosalvus amylolyticus TaxID=2961994 RepID=UPI0020C94252|nr:hypothetical protein [Natronosalvus amylolyticus]
MLGLAGFAERFRAHPVAATIELASFLGCFVLAIGTFVAISSGAPTGSPGDDWLWLAVIAGGGVFVVFWTALVPLYERGL